MGNMLLSRHVPVLLILLIYIVCTGTIFGDDAVSEALSTFKFGLLAKSCGASDGPATSFALTTLEGTNKFPAFLLNDAGSRQVSKKPGRYTLRGFGLSSKGLFCRKENLCDSVDGYHIELDLNQSLEGTAKYRIKYRGAWTKGKVKLRWYSGKPPICG
jgi:hypothetical protein